MVLASFQLGSLLVGHKKDVVLTPLLATTYPKDVAIYGWTELNGVPIQGLNAKYVYILEQTPPAIVLSLKVS
jgi:hypothetical protein